jgi:hypothetical protein
MADGARVTGGCECGRIRYSARREASSGESCFCHCLQCQRISGGPFLPFIDFKKKDIEWTTKPDTYRSSGDAERGFCKVCGSTLTMTYHFQEDSLGVTLGTLDQDCGFVPVTKYHIFVKDVAAWSRLPNDGLPRHQEFNDNDRYQQGLKQWRESHPKGEAK